MIANKAQPQEIEFLTLDSNDTQRIPRSFVFPGILSQLRKIVRNGHGGIADFSLLVTLDAGCAAFTSLFEGLPLANGVVCWNASISPQAFDHAMQAWADCNGIAGRGLHTSARQRPAIVPWVAVSLFHFAAQLDPVKMGVWGTLHSCLAWAIVTEAESLREAQTT